MCRAAHCMFEVRKVNVPRGTLIWRGVPRGTPRYFRSNGLREHGARSGVGRFRVHNGSVSFDGTYLAATAAGAAGAAACLAGSARCLNLLTRPEAFQSIT